MSKVLVSQSSLQNIANAIRSKNRSTNTYTPAEMATAISQIHTGMNLTNDTRLVFIDYDGTILASYTGQEAQALTALPANPTHSGLIAQGWNWTLAQIKAQLTAYSNQTIYVGQMYITQSGDTEIDVHFADDAKLSPIMSIAVNGTVTIDWGDNTTPDSLTGTSLTTRLDPTHTYTMAGDYTIIIHVVSGSFQFYTSSSYLILRKNTTMNQNRIYANTIQAIRLGNGISNLYSYTFYACHSLASITIPNEVTSIGTHVFAYCHSLTSITIPKEVTSIETNVFTECCVLASITIPKGVTSIGSNAFSYCYSLTSITIPKGVTSIGNSVFSYCYSLASIIIPNEVTSIGSNAFSYCHSLNSITISNGDTSIGSSMFSYCYALASITIPNEVTSIGSSAFSNCYSLASIIIPNGVTSIGDSAFNNCYGVAEYHILPTTVPTGGTTMFNNIVSDCIIYVPKGTLSNYQGASNWSTYASYMQEES